jgi:uncharacterized membrane protein YoaK (UPF0700 family)
MTSMADRGVGNAALVLACLSFASGCTDVLSFLEFGDVFTSAMTGNTALLAVALGSGHMLGASHSLTALLGFALGAMLAAALNGRRRDPPDARRRLGRLLAIETACLAGCATLWIASRAAIGGNGPLIVILLSAIGMGIQGVAARIVNAAGISTVVFTSVLIRIVTALTEALARRADAAAPLREVRGHLGSFAAYALGGLLAGMLVTRYVELAVWLPMVAVLLALGCSRMTGEPRGREP